MVDELTRVIREGPHPWAYGLVALAAAIEYVFPPFPGDSVALLAVFLAVRAQLSWFFVYAAMTAGATLGGVLAWAFGRWLAGHERDWPPVLRSVRVQAGLDAVRRGYAQHGPWYLVLNRFLPAFRAFFFVGAGLSKMELLPVVIFGGISAALWNALLLGAGYALGQNWDALQHLFAQYTMVTLALVLLVALVWVLRKR